MSADFACNDCYSLRTRENVVHKTVNIVGFDALLIAVNIIRRTPTTCHSSDTKC